MKNRVKKIAMLGLLVVFLSVIAAPAFGAPITGKTGNRIQMNFMYQDPDPADAGKYIDLRWQVVNTIPGETENLKFHLDAGYPFTFEAGDTPDKYLGNSAGTGEDNVYYVLHYKLKVADNALKGTYNVTLSWTTGEGWTKKEFPIYVDPQRSDFVVGALVTSPEKLVADTDEAKLSVNIENIGDGDAKNVKVKLLLPEGFKPTYSYSDEDSPGIIERGKSKQINFYVDIDENIKEGEYKAKLEISYKDENDESDSYITKTLDLKIPVKPAPLLIVDSVTSTPEELVPGTEAIIKVKVKNTGNEKAQSVSLRVFKDSSQPFEFSEKSDFIGKLGPGESGDAAIRFAVDKNAIAKKYLLDVELRGIDKNDNVLIFRRTVPLTTNEETKNLPLKTFGLMGGFLVIGSVGAVHYLRNGRRKNDSNNN